MADFAKTVILPAYNKGERRFAIPNTYKGRVMNTSDERWKQVLNQNKAFTADFDLENPENHSI